MARGSLRSAAQHAYRGAAGATRQGAIHVTLPSGDVASVQVYTAVDVIADPELGQRLLSDDPARALNTVKLADGTALVLATPVVYHDPGAEVLVLVLADGDRHRELAERARLLHEMAADPATAIPGYARDFQVVFGARGLRALLEDKAERAVASARTGEVERERDRARIRDLERRAAEADGLRHELDRAKAELDRAKAELDLLRADAARKAPAPAPAPRRATTGGGRMIHDDVETGPFALGDDIDTATQAPILAVESPRSKTATDTDRREAGVGALSASPMGRGQSPHDIDESVIGPPPELPAGSDPLTTVTADLPTGGQDAWLDAFAAAAATSMVHVDDHGVRLALRVSGATAVALGRGPLDLRLQLHRTPFYPVVTLTVGTPQALRGAGDPRVCAALDFGGEIEKRALATLSKRFTLIVELIADGKRLRRATVSAPLEENAAYIARAAHDHLRTLSAEAGAQGSPSLPRARQLLADPGYDLLGAHHPECSEFRDDKLGQLNTANMVRRALAIARRFTRPSREDYLVTVRGYPLARWQDRRRAVLARTVEWGLWMGPELAQVAVSEGLARSKKDLIAKLEAAFSGLLGDAVANDLDGDAAEDNRKALAEEARTLGVARGETNRPSVASDAEPVASGTIERAATARPTAVDVKAKSIEDLTALLEDRTHRLAAALELCERAERRSIRPVLNTARRMPRTEAVRVLGAMVKFGEAAATALTAGLGSSKSFLRHGCALALGMLRTEQGTEAVIDLLLAEPTEIWRELARAVGQIGPAALMPLAARLGRQGDRLTASAKERAAWAMAHIAVRGGRTAVETLAGGHSVVAPVARQAVELMEPAARDDLRGTGGGKEVTVNRAFSRKFFEVLSQPGVTLSGVDASGPMELLDEDDLIDVEGDEDADEELDESDLIEG